MNALSHTAFEDALVLTDLAQRIVTDGAKATLHCNLSDREIRTWASAASWFLAAQADGLDDEDFAEMVDEHFNPASDQGWALDMDFLRDERAEQSVWGMA